MIGFKEAVQLAKEQGACGYAIDELSTLANWDEFWGHERAAEWSYWYCCKVSRERWIEAEEVIFALPYFSKKYSKLVKALNRKTKNHESR